MSILGVAAEAGALLAYARLSQHTLAPARIPFAAVLRIDLATLAASHVTPAGSVVGVGLGYRLLTRSGVPPAKAVSAKTVQAVGSTVVLNLLLAIALTTAVARYGTTGLYSTAAALILAVLGTVAVVAVTLIRQPQRCAKWASALAAALAGVQRASGERLAASLTEALLPLTYDRRFLLTTTTWAALNWLLDAAALWCAVAAFGHPLGAVGLGVALGLANLFAAIPLTPGGLGIIEGVLLPVLISFHTPHADAVLGITTWRLLNFWAPIPIGFAALAITRRPDRLLPPNEDAVGARASERGNTIAVTDTWSRPPQSTVLAPSTLAGQGASGLYRCLADRSQIASGTDHTATDAVRSPDSLIPRSPCSKPRPTTAATPSSNKSSPT